jgi:hypothetical protein
MNDRWRDVGDPQTAFMEAKGELRLKARLQPQNVPPKPARSNSPSTIEDTQPQSCPHGREGGQASASPKTIQSP